jgi:peptidoglycan/LPS O-acetylase OafA/YrhL
MFFPGVLLFWFFTKQMSRNLFLGLMMALLILGYLKGGVQTPICAIISIGFILLVKKPIKPLIFLGTISYSLYLIHTPFGTDGIINFLQNYIDTEIGKMVLLLLCLPITLFAAWVFYRIIEKPSMKLSKTVSYSEIS